MHGSEFSDLPDLCSLKPEGDGLWYRATSACCRINGHVSDQAMGNFLVVAEKLTVNLKTSLINPFWIQSHEQLVSTMHSFVEAGAAVHNWECSVGKAFLVTTSRENRFSFNAKELQALFPCLMAPAQQLMKMHHAGSIGVAETHCSGEVEPSGSRHQVTIWSLWPGLVTLGSVRGWTR